MTGFGRGESSSNGYQITVEVKTLNSRYLDISIRMPQSLQHHEFSLKEIVQEKLSRGKVHVNINIEETSAVRPDIIFNEKMVRLYSKMLEQVKFVANIQQPVQMSDLLQFDGLFEKQKDDEEEIKIIWNCACEALDEAISNLNDMRAKEGEELKIDLIYQVNGIAEMLDTVNELSAKRLPEMREKLQNRIKNLVNDDKIDPDRMDMEVVLLVDKMDINEEIIRLQSHLKFFLETLVNNSPVGRRLNFLCQEINRELNTIGSKANDSAISHHIVVGKEKLEQIREQVQNIE
ncbi:MAG: YicC family protein [Balneolaceae bacterium]|nr:MAG: YicC family protein [Balneolaceae bacterium]